LAKGVPRTAVRRGVKRRKREDRAGGNKGSQTQLVGKNHSLGNVDAQGRKGGEQQGRQGGKLLGREKKGTRERTGPIRRRKASAPVFRGRGGWRRKKKGVWWKSARSFSYFLSQFFGGKREGGGETIIARRGKNRKEGNEKKGKKNLTSQIEKRVRGGRSKRHLRLLLDRVLLREIKLVVHRQTA